MLDRIVLAMYGEEASELLAVKVAARYSAERAMFLETAEHAIREAEDILGIPSPEYALRSLRPPPQQLEPPEKFAEWSTPLSGIPGSGPLLGGLAAGIGDRDAVSGLGTGFGSLLGQSAGGALGGMVGPHAGRALAKMFGEKQQVGEDWGRALGTLGGSALGGALGGYVGRQQTRPPMPQQQPAAQERQAEYKLAGLSDQLAALSQHLPGNSHDTRLPATLAALGPLLHGVAGPVAGGVAAGMQTNDPWVGAGTGFGAALGQGVAGALAQHILPIGGLPVTAARMLGGGMGAHYGKKLTDEHRHPFMSRFGSEKHAGPMGTLLSRAVAPAAIGALGAYVASPQDPDAELRNTLSGAGIGGGLGLLHALHKSFSANPGLAQQLMQGL